MDTIQAVESKLTDITVTAVRPMSLVTNNNKARSGNPPIHSPVTIHRPSQSQLPSINISALPMPMLSTTPPASSSSNSANNLSKYAQLLLVIEELGKDIRPTYSGSRSSAERLKRAIVHARMLVRECLIETERSARSNN